MEPAPFVLSPALAAALATSAAVALFLPVVLAVAWRRATGAPWRALGMGALVFRVAQPVLRLPWQIPLSRLVGGETGGHGPAFLGFMLFSSLTAGLFEEIGRWAGYRWLLRGDRSARTGVMFGVGHGGLESMLLVGLSLAGALVAAVLASQGKLPEPALSAVRAQLGGLAPATALAGGFERVSALLVHVGLSLVVLQAFVRPGGWRWVALSVLLHAGVNGVAVSLLPLGVWPTEAAVAALAIGVLCLGWRLARPLPPRVAHSAAERA
jgi:uncharacterized membrane protein YhfC